MAFRGFSNDAPSRVPLLFEEIQARVLLGLPLNLFCVFNDGVDLLGSALEARVVIEAVFILGKETTALNPKP